MASRGFHALPITAMHSPVVSPAARASGSGSTGFGAGAGHASARTSDVASAHEPPRPTHRRRDQEASRMTAFPTPGFSTAASSATAVAQPPKTTGSLAVKQAAGRTSDAPRSASMYWMPDHLCKTCYDCGASFSLFRRRHHCRLCGQIFCHACSSQFVDGTAHGFRHQMIRICKFCARYVTADAEKRQRQLSTVSGGASRRASVDDASLLLQQQTGLGGAAPQASASVPATGASSMPPMSSPLLFSPVNAAAAIPLPRDESTERLSDEFDSEAHATMDDRPGPPPVLFSIMSSESVDFSTEAPPEPVPVKTFRRPSLVRRRRSSLEFLNGGDSVAPPATTTEAETTSTEDVAESNTDKPAPLRHETESFRIKTDLHTQHEIVLDKYMKAAHDRIREGIGRAVDRSMKHFVGDAIEAKRLVSSLEDMAFISTGHLLFSMNFRTNNGFNFNGLVKVKSIATPTDASSSPGSKGKDPYSFKWLAGCVCRKQLSHKQMARKIDHPRVLLLACAISYDRSAGTGKLSSLDALIESEKSYMGILVDKISKLEPDIVFVERTVSRHAQELLRERGIAIVLNVKHETLERIARYTGATVLPSVDHVDQANPDEVIGKCRSFYAQTVPVAVDDEVKPPTDSDPNDSATTNGNGNANISVQRAGSTRAKTETYLYLDGCDPLNGCTVLITGPSKKKLKTMKTLTSLLEHVGQQRHTALADQYADALQLHRAQHTRNARAVVVQHEHERIMTRHTGGRQQLQTDGQERAT